MQATRILRQMEAHLSKPTNLKGHQSKYVCLWGWFVNLMLTSPCLSSGKNVTKHTNTEAYKTTIVFKGRLDERKALDQMALQPLQVTINLYISIVCRYKK